MEDKIVKAIEELFKALQGANKLIEMQSNLIKEHRKMLTQLSDNDWALHERLNKLEQIHPELLDLKSIDKPHRLN